MAPGSSLHLGSDDILYGQTGPRETVLIAPRSQARGRIGYDHHGSYWYVLTKIGDQTANNDWGPEARTGCSYAGTRIADARRKARRMIQELGGGEIEICNKQREVVSREQVPSPSFA